MVDVTGPDLATLIRNSGIIPADMVRRVALTGLTLDKNGTYHLSPPQINRWLNRRLEEYPLPATIESLAMALNVSYDTVVAACTVSLDRPRIWRPEGDGATVLTDEHVTPESVSEMAARVRRVARGL